MPKGRMLNKKISYSEKVNNLSLEASLLFTWCIPHLDVEGRIYGSAKVLKGMVVPLRDELTIPKIEKCIEEMVTQELIIYYGDKQKYIQFKGFQEEQRIDKNREAKSDIPTPENSRELQKTLGKLSKVKSSEVKLSKDNTFIENKSVLYKEVITHYNKLQGFTEEDYKDIPYSRLTKTCKALFSMCGFDKQQVLELIDYVSAWAKGKGLPWTLETCIKRFTEWKKEVREVNQDKQILKELEEMKKCKT